LFCEELPYGQPHIDQPLDGKNMEVEDLYISNHEIRKMNDVLVPEGL
jgi:hypothetical protein